MLVDLSSPIFPILIHLRSLPLSRSRGSSRRNTRRRRGLAKEGNGGGGTAGRGRYGGAEHAEVLSSFPFLSPRFSSAHDSDSQPLSALACSQILMARSPAKAAAVRPRLGGIPNPLPAPSACRLQDPVARKLCVLPCHGRGARRTRMYEANATATESTAKTSSTSKSLVPIDQRGDLQLGTAFTVSPLLTYAFMHASCLIKIQIERIVLDEIVANTVWW